MDRQKLRSSHSKPRHRSRRSYALIAIGVVIAAPVVACVVFVAQLNPNAYAPQLIEAVQQATGRTLSLGGPLQLQLSLTPTLTASDVSLSNPATFNAPALLTLKQVQARIALLPLLHHRLDILELKLVQPKLYLERNANGQADWTLRPAPSAASAPQATRKQGSRAAYSLALESVSVEDGEISFRPNGAAQPTLIQLSRFTGKADSLSAPLHITGAAAIGAMPLTLQGVVGPVAGLTGGDSHPWPVDLTFGYAGASAKMRGQITHPQRLRGYDLQVSTQIPALEQLSAAIPAAWLHGKTLPALHDVSASFTMADEQAGQLKLSDIVVEAGKSDLSHLWPGLQLTALKASLPDISATGTLAITGDINQLPLAIQAQWTGASGFLTPISSPANATPTVFSGTVNASLGAATASLKGEIATPQSLSGAVWALTLNVPDLSMLSAAWGTPLPAWKDIAAKTMLTDSGGQGLANGIALDGLTATMQNARFGGNAKLTWGSRPYLKLNLAIASANLDALRAAMPAASPSTGEHLSPAPRTPPTTTITAAAPLFGVLRLFDADASVNADQLVYNQTPYSALQTYAVLKNGLLTIAPFSVQMPGGAISAKGSLDMNVEPAAETLKLNAPALALDPLLKMLNLPLSGLAQGTVQVQINASSRGDTLAAMLGSVSGQFGVASVNDEIDGALINQLFGQALRATGLPATAIDVSGPTFVRCFALRLDAQNGSGRFKALALDSSRLLLVGGGSVNFASQTLGVVLKPQMRVGGNDIIIPVAIDGPFAKPHYGIASQDALKAAAQGAGGLIDHAGEPLFGSSSIIGKVLGALTNHDSKDVCETALPLARIGQSGPAPHEPTAHNDTSLAPSPAANSGPRSLLKALLNQ